MDGWVEKQMDGRIGWDRMRWMENEMSMGLLKAC